MQNILRPPLALFVLFTLLFGGIYPGVITLAARALFPRQSQGSLIEKNGQVLGSKLIGQNFTAPKYFWGRLSATTPFAYNASASSASNLGAASPALLDAVKSRIQALKKADPKNPRSIPVDLVTASGSGLDPDISPAAAEYQIARVAKARGIPAHRVSELVEKYTTPRTFGLLGEPGVNVLLLNLSLDGEMP
jgi:K+-transporting ATPase ATPase C chain